MKRTDLVRNLNSMKCICIRHGGKHDWYQNPKTKMVQPVPRHAEINENLAKSILKKMKD